MKKELLINQPKKTRERLFDELRNLEDRLARVNEKIDEINKLSVDYQKEELLHGGATIRPEDEASMDRTLAHYKSARENLTRAIKRIRREFTNFDKNA